MKKKTDKKSSKKEIKEEVIEPLKEESKEPSWEEKYTESNDKYLRLYSEFENFRRRTQKEKIELYSSAGADVLKALLPILDDFERAENAMQENNEDVEGMKLIHNKLKNILEKQGLTPLKSSIGSKFDVLFHEAITQIAAPTEKEKGCVIDEVEKGYMLNEKVIRYAKVVVGQ